MELKRAVAVNTGQPATSCIPVLLPCDVTLISALKHLHKRPRLYARRSAFRMDLSEQEMQQSIIQRVGGIAHFAESIECYVVPDLLLAFPG
jgi:hypothetical protein